MALKRKRARAGDIVELSAPDGVVYLHYIGRHSEYGDAVVVCPVKYYERPSDKTQIFSGGYIAFYPVQAAVSQCLAEIVGKLPSPGLPKRLRRPGKRSGRRIENWIVEDERGREVLKDRLSNEDRLLPIAAIWNHELLLQRISEGWRPESEG